MNYLLYKPEYFSNRIVMNFRYHIYILKQYKNYKIILKKHIMLFYVKAYFPIFYNDS